MIKKDRDELIRLRARLVVVEQAAMAALELGLRVRPAEMRAQIESTRKRLSQAYVDPTFASDVVDDRERALLAAEVERLMRGLQENLGFREGIQQPEEG